MTFEPGRRKTGGRVRGTPNKLTATFREAVQIVYDRLGGHRAFFQWATENQTDFYRIAARLIPVEMRTEDTQKVVVIVDRNAGCGTVSPAASNPALEDHCLEKPTV